MGGLEKMKDRYDEIVIPEELTIRIQQEIEKSRRQQAEKKGAGQKHRLKKAIRSMEAAAAVCILFTAALNMSPVFAKEAAQFPVIGGLARVLTFRSYETEKDDIAVSVEIPTIEMIAEDTGIAVDEINQEIFTRCNQYAEDAILRAEEYRTAFLETGGTPEEWAEHKIKVTVDYEIKQQNSDYLSFVVRGTENWTNANSDSKYYNIDLNTGKLVTLEDMLGSNYIELINRSIREQIAERQHAGETFFSEAEGGFTGISEDVRFYINGNNRPVIVFDKYEIAPGASGEIEFEIGADLTGWGENRQSRPDTPQDSKQNVLQDTRQDIAADGSEIASAEKTDQIAAEFEDNFAVDSEAAREFAEKVKAAAANRDLEALAELTAFPVYVGLPDIHVVETKEDFLSLGAESVFTEELLKSVETAEIEDFQPSMAGFSISGVGTANIIFGVADGSLAINGINY